VVPFKVADGNVAELDLAALIYSIEMGCDMLDVDTFAGFFGRTDCRE
jgi:hypothetical protein